MRDEDLVLIPRRVIGAACGALGRSDKKDCAALVDLRSYASHPDTTPQSSAPVVGDALRAAAQAVVTGKVNPSAGRTRLVMLKDVQALESALTGRG